MMGSSSCWAMKTRRLFVACALATLARAPVYGHAAERRVQEQDDFKYPAGGPDLEGSDPSGVTSSGITVNEFPGLEDQRIGMSVVNVEACGINLPSVHPQATEMVYMLSGTLRTAFVEESGGTRRAIVNDISAGDATFYPQGLISYQQNLGCEKALYVVGVNSEDPGEDVEGITGVTDPGIATLMAGLPSDPATARQECLMECGLPPDAQSCPGSIEGIFNAEWDVCCSLSCGECGGPGCGNLPGGIDKCCTSRVMESGVYCDESGSAPCVIGSDPMTTCPGGIEGIVSATDHVCCPLSCGQCGGSGCGNLPGGIDKCCTSRVKGSGVYCDESGSAPCIIGSRRK